MAENKERRITGSRKKVLSSSKVTGDFWLDYALLESFSYNGNSATIKTA
jgi:hypothetical protein